MKIATHLAAIAALSMAAAPAAARNPASSLSLSASTRAGAATHDRSDLAGLGGAYVAVAVLFVVLGAIFIAADNDTNSRSA